MVSLLNTIGAIIQTGTKVVKGITDSSKLKDCNASNLKLGTKTKTII